MEIDSIDFDDSCLTWALETGLWDGRSVTWEEAPQFSLEVGEKVMQFLFSKDPTTFEFHQMAAHLALLTAHPSERLAISKEIQPISPAKFGKTVSKIWKEHKVAIIVSAALIATAIVIVVVTTTTAGTATAPAIAAGGAALDSLCNSPEESQKKVPTANSPKKAEVETQKAEVKKIAQTPFPLKQPPEMPLDKPSFAKMAKEAGSSLTHEIFDAIVSLGADIPKIAEATKNLADSIAPTPSFPDNDLLAFTKNYEESVAKGHETIDRFFSTHQAHEYTPEAKEKKALNNPVTIGILPPPGMLSKGIDLSKIQQLIKTGGRISAAAEELGFSAREIARLEKTGKLESTVATTFENITHNKTFFESCKKFKEAADVLRPYMGKYLPENQVRELIHQTGIPTFPRPKGIPENFRVKLSGKGAGIKYVHPTNEGIYIRVMPGKPHSLNPNQKKPYVNRRMNGHSLDKNGNFVSNDSAEAHIPIEEFVYKDH